VKYRALSTRHGRITVKWGFEEADGQRRLVLHRMETGLDLSGDTPRRRGFGTEVIERTLAYDLGGEASLEFTPDGLMRDQPSRSGWHRGGRADRVRHLGRLGLSPECM
jgi:two-component system CheB/CheR fusion protein